jgi:lipopolysaccharide heptosyltransferase II
MPAPKTWARCTKLLCIRLDNMGDVLMTTPAIRALKETVPRRTVTLLASPAGAAIARMVPEVDRIVELNAPWAKHKATMTHRKLLAAAAMLFRQRFDAAVIFTTYSQSPLPAALLCYLAGIRRVLGYCRENPYSLISDWIPDPEPHELVRHETERQLNLAAATGACTTNARLSLQVPGKALAGARSKLACLGLDPSRPWCIMHPGASEEKRLFQPQRLTQAAAQLMREGWQVVLTGSPAEREYVGRMHHALNEQTVNAAGSLSVEELAAAITQARVLVSNNTGPVHMAAAAGTPVVVLYAQTNPQHTPWQVPNRVLYFPVPHKSLSRNRLLQGMPWPHVPEITPEQIVRAVQELVQKGVQ